MTKPFITDRRRKRQEHYIERAFVGMVGGVSRDTILVKYEDNAQEGNAFGSARPRFQGESVPLLCLIQDQKTEENKTAWGTDLSITALAMCLKTHAQANNISTMDRISFDGTEYAIKSIHDPRGMGHETALTFLRLQPTTHKKA